MGLTALAGFGNLVCRLQQRNHNALILCDKGTRGRRNVTVSEEVASLLDSVGLKHERTRQFMKNVNRLLIRYSFRCEPSNQYRPSAVRVGIGAARFTRAAEPVT